MTNFRTYLDLAWIDDVIFCFVAYLPKLYFCCHSELLCRTARHIHRLDSLAIEEGKKQLLSSSSIAARAANVNTNIGI